MVANPVITSAQARQITGGRTPLVPVEYEQAVTALQACISLDETKYWSDKADALAAWAKIYRNDDAGRKAKMLKLHAYRRMGSLAGELNPRKSTKGTSGRGSVPGSGPKQLLIKHGLSKGEAAAARALSALPDRRFEKLLKNPIAPTTAENRLRDNTVWREVQTSAMSLRSRFRRHTPAQTAETMSEVEKTSAKKLFTELAEWIDDFDSRLARKAR